MATNTNGICAVRVSKLDAAGAPIPQNATGAWCSTDIAQIDVTPDYEDGTVTTVKNGCGLVRFYRRREDTLTGLTVANFNMITGDNGMMETFLSGQAAILLDGADEIGWALLGTSCEETLTTLGVVIEVWFENWDCQQPDGEFPYKRGVIPWAQLRYNGGSHTEGHFVHSFSGSGRMNASLDDGPFNDFPASLAALDGYLYAEFDDTELPELCVAGDYTPTIGTLS